MGTWLGVLVGKLDISPVLCFSLLLIGTAIGFLPASIDFLRGHDHLDHLMWNIEFLDVLRAGIFYPRWLPNVNQGDGAPSFVFYGPLFSYATALFSWKLGVVQGMKIASFLFWWGSGVAMYLCARHWLPRSASLVAALTYVFMPYHVYDLYTRAALAEFAQFLWLPLIVLCLAKLPEGGARPIVALGFCVAGAIVTHLITAALVIYLLAAVGVIALFRLRSFCLRIAMGVAWGMILSSIYLLPALWEHRFINPSLFLTNNGYYTSNFLFSPAETEVKKWALFWALAQASLLAPLLLVCGLPRLSGGGDVSGERGMAALRRDWLALGLLAVFMMLPLSAWIWKLPGLHYLQFPWRWLLVGSFAASFLVGLRFWLLSQTRLIWKIALLVFLVANVGLAARLWSHRLASALEGPRDHSELLQKVRYYRDLNCPPRWVSNVEERFRSRRGEAPKPPVEIVQGTGRADVLEWSPNRRRVALEVETNALVKLRTFYYPGWSCELDGNATPIDISPEGQIAVPVPAGRHHVACSFSNTPVRTAGGLISLMACLASLGVVLVNPKMKEHG